MTGGQSRRDVPGICDNLKLYFLIEAIRETYREAGELKFFARLNLAAWRPDLDWRMADRIEPWGSPFRRGSGRPRQQKAALRYTIQPSWRVAK
jgi:hypothetical protein